MIDTFLDKLSEAGPRLPWVQRWLLQDVWSPERYKTESKTDFLNGGESQVTRFESLVSSAAPRVYDEFGSGPDPSRQLLNILVDNNTAVVVYDGLSLREIPIILSLTEKSGFNVMEVGCSLAAIPSETIDFVEREFQCGRIGPSQLTGRRDLKERGICAIYHENHALPLLGDYEETSLLVWSPFPDMTYRDSGARFESHFEKIHLLFETAWVNIIQHIKGKRKIVVTSDHGYIYLGTGMDFPRSASQQRELNDYFGNDRNVSIKEKPNPPQTDDVFVDTNREVAILKGRVKTRSTGEVARKLYKHGGFSLMEMITPWIQIEMG